MADIFNQLGIKLQRVSGTDLVNLAFLSSGRTVLVAEQHLNISLFYMNLNPPFYNCEISMEKATQQGSNSIRQLSLKSQELNRTQSLRVVILMNDT
jgi:hypothetical protein